MGNRDPKIYLFCCSSSIEPIKIAQGNNKGSDDLRVIALPCSGRADILYLMKAFETGADGVAVVMCRQGECRYLEGNLRARKRAEAVNALLEEIGLGGGRMAIIQMNDGGIEQVVREVESFRARIESLTSQGNGTQVLVSEYRTV